MLATIMVSTISRTSVTPTLSVTVALTVTVEPTLLLFPGEEMVTVGAVLSLRGVPPPVSAGGTGNGAPPSDGEAPLSVEGEVPFLRQINPLLELWHLSEPGQSLSL